MNQHYYYDEPQSEIEEYGIEYVPLATERNDIRILRILPGFWTDAIECELITESLDTSPSYQALSYAWGYSGLRKSLFVNGQAVVITHSAESALRQLRHAHEPVTIWVDALCINQNDEKEKSHQVGLMHRVYQQCSNVIIWLGPEEPPIEPIEYRSLFRRWFPDAADALQNGVSTLLSCFGSRKRLLVYDELIESCTEASGDPFAMVEHFAQDKHISELSCFSPSLLSNDLVFKETPQFRSMWIRFRQLLQTPWHSRFWCVQEALLPSNACVIYGSWRIPFSTITRSLQNHRKHIFTCCSKVEKEFPTGYAFCVDSLYTEPAPTQDLDYLLRMYRYKDCYDPKDKVFGILALLDTAAELEVDYLLSVGQVYTNAMNLILANSHGNLRCLTGQGFGSDYHGIPSWVRDFELSPSTASVQFEMRRLQAYDLFDASRSMQGQSLAHEKRQLRVSGILVDTIEQVCTPLDMSVENSDWRSVIKVLLNWRSAAKIAGDKTSLIRPNVRDQAFWRTILSDLVAEPGCTTFRRFTDDDVEPCQRWLRQAVMDWVTFRRPTMLDCYVQALLCAAYGRSFFVTSGGHLGLCYPTARARDEIWILKGGRVPFILRSRSKAKTLARNYRLVGDCYLYGFMDGEAVAEPGLNRASITLT